MSNREIKFRAWHKKNKVMFWWDLLWGNKERGGGYIGMIEWGEARKVNFHGDNRKLVDPYDCEIMQFTGLQDANGVDIYEGDIVEIRMHNGEILTGIIKWNKKHCEFCNMVFKNGNGAHGVCFSGSVVKGNYVIGNVHENPELLNNKKGQQNE